MLRTDLCSCQPEKNTEICLNPFHYDTGNVFLCLTHFLKHSYFSAETLIFIRGTSSYLFFSPTRDNRGKGILIKNILIQSSYR